MAAGDRLLGASFRGVPFFVPERTQSGGRRGGTHEFPQRDRPDGDDMGRRARTFRVQAQILGDFSSDRDSYMSARDNLLTALEAAGPGIYVDPWRGRQAVIARTYEMRENVTAGGIAEFTITFEEEGQALFPSAGIDTKSAAEAAASDLAAASLSSFADVFSLSGVPQFVRDDAAQTLDALGTTVGGLVAGMADVEPSIGESLSGVSGAVDAFSLGVPDAVSGSDASAVGAAVSGLFEGLITNVAGAENARIVFAALHAFDPGLPTVPQTTATRLRQAGNRRSLLDLVSAQALAQEARTLARSDFANADAAGVLRSAFLSRLDARRATVGGGGGAFNDDAFRSLGVLRGAVIKDMSARTQGLPRLRSLSTPSAVPSVVLAHRLYGDATRADEIMTLNPGVNHGGKVPGFLGVSVLDG